MVASQCLSSRRRSWYIFTSSWPTCASPSLFPRGLASRDISKGSRSIVSPLGSGSSLSKRGIGRLVDRPRTGSSIEQLFFFPGQRALSFRHLSPLFDSIFGAVAPLTFRLSSSQIFRSSVLYDRRYIGRCLSNVHCRRFLCVTRAYSRGRRWKSYDDLRGMCARNGHRLEQDLSRFRAIFFLDCYKEKVARFTNRLPRILRLIVTI